MSGIADLFGGLGGSSAKKDRQTELGGFGDLKSVFNFALPMATGGAQAGQGNLDTASAYWNKLLSGNRATIQQANAPAINATLSGADAAKRQQASMGTARGGGVAGENRTIDDKTRATIDNALFATRPEAAKEVGKIGTVEMSDALNALGVAGTTAENITGLAMDSRKESQAIHDSTVGNIGDAIGSIVSSIAGAFT